MKSDLPDLYVDLGDLGQHKVDVKTWKSNENAIISVKCELCGVKVELLPLLTKDALSALQDQVDMHFMSDDGDLADHLHRYKEAA